MQHNIILYNLQWYEHIIILYNMFQKWQLQCSYTAETHHVTEYDIYEKALTLRGLWSWSSREGSLGPGLTRWEHHLDGAHILDIRPWEVASLFGALVVPEEPAEALRLLHTALLVVLHGQQRGLADCQKVSRLQIQVLFLVLGKCVEGKVLKTLRRHFVRETKIKMATE